MKKIADGTQGVSMKKMRVYMLIVCAFAAGCAQIDTAPAFGDGESIEIRRGATAGFDGLRMGLGNVSKSDYADEAGEKKHGLVAALWLFISGNPRQEKRFDVYAGQNVRMGEYSVYVQEIRGGLKGSVLLRVKRADHDSVP